LDEQYETIPDELVAINLKSHHQVKLDMINAMHIANNFRGITEPTPEVQIQSKLNSIIETDEEFNTS
jgi:hypothetical protein